VMATIKLNTPTVIPRLVITKSSSR
jgi:hypothetical protein